MADGALTEVRVKDHFVPDALKGRIDASRTKNNEFDELKQTVDDSHKGALKIVLASMQNQDPLEPLKSSELSQLTTSMFTTEGIMQNTKSVSNMAQLFDKYVRGQARQDFGTSITWIGNEFTFNGDKQEIDYYVPELLDDARIRILSPDNAVVYEGILNMAEGLHHFVWDGKRVNGEKANIHEDYKISLQGISKKDGAVVPIYPRLKGEVTGVDYTIDHSVYRMVGNVPVKADEVLQQYKNPKKPLLNGLDQPKEINIEA